MGTQPLLFNIDVDAFETEVAAHRPRGAMTCPRLNPNGMLTTATCWNMFRRKFTDCCALCDPRGDEAMSLEPKPGRPAVLRSAQDLPSHMYGWAEINWDDAVSWIRASELDPSMWLLWAVLTHQTTHLTTDYGGNGLRGFLTASLLPDFISHLRRVRAPRPEDERAGLDLYRSHDEFASLQQVIGYAESCLRQGVGMAWARDYVY